MDLSVAMLEMAKRNFVVKEKWRPTDKTVEEQFRPHMAVMLTKQRDMLRKQIEEQNEQIAVGQTLVLLKLSKSQVLTEFSESLMIVFVSQTEIDPLR